MPIRVLYIFAFIIFFSGCSSTTPRGKDLYDNFCLGYEEEYVSKRKNDELILKYTDAIHNNPDDAKNYSCRGLAYLYKEDFISAESDLSSAIGLYSGTELTPTLLFIRGLTYDRLSKVDLAIDDYEESYRLASWEGRHYSIITYCLAVAYLNKSNISKAQKYSNLAVKWQKFNDYPHYIRSLVNIEKLDYASALEDITAAINHSGDKKDYIQYNYNFSQNPKALYLTHRAYIYGELQRPIAANEDLKSAFKRGINDQDVLTSIARILAISSSPKVRDSDLAIQIAKKSLSMSAKPPFAAIEALAHGLADKGEFTQALILLNQALEDDEQYIGVLWRERAELARDAFSHNMLLYPVYE